MPGRDRVGGAREAVRRMRPRLVVLRPRLPARAAWKTLGHKELCPQVAGGALRRQRAERAMAPAGEAAAAAVGAVTITEE